MKKGMLPIQFLIYMILGLIVLGVSAPVINTIIEGGKTPTKDMMEGAKKDFLGIGDDGGFVPYEYEMGSDDPNYIKAKSSYDTLVVSLNLLSKNLSEIKKEVSDVRSGSKYSLTGKATNDLSTGCCKLKDYSYYYLGGPKSQCDENAQLCYQSIGNPYCGDFDESKIKLYTDKKSCIEINLGVGGGITVKNFTLAQDVPTEWNDQMADYVTFQNNPDYLVYFEKFPAGADKWNKQANIPMLIAFGAQAGISMIPVIGKVLKTRALKAGAAVLSPPKAAAGKIIKAINSPSKAPTTIYDEVVAADQVLEAILSSPIAKKQFLNAFGDGSINYLEQAKSIRTALTDAPIKNLADNIGGTADWYAKRLGIEMIPTELKGFEKIIIDVNNPQTTAKGLKEFDKLLKEKFKKKIYPKYKPLTNADKEAKLFFETIDALDPEKSLDNIVKGFSKTSATNSARLTKMTDRAAKRLDNLIDAEGGLTKEFSKKFSSESQIDELVDVFSKNKGKIPALGNVVSNNPLYKGTFKFLGSSDGTIKSLLKNQLKYGTWCTATTAGVAGITTLNTVTTVPTGGGSNIVLSPVAGMLTTSMIKNCAGLVKTNIFPLILFYSLLADSDVVAADKYFDDGSGVLAFDQMSNFEVVPTNDKIKNHEDRNIIMKGETVKGKYVDFHLISPCKVDFTVKNEYCKIDYFGAMGPIITQTPRLNIEEGDKDIYDLVPYTSSQDNIVDIMTPLYLWDEVRGADNKILTITDDFKRSKTVDTTSGWFGQFVEFVPKMFDSAESKYNKDFLKIAMDYEDIRVPLKIMINGDSPIDDILLTCENFINDYKKELLYNYFYLHSEKPRYPRTTESISKTSFLAHLKRININSYEEFISLNLNSQTKKLRMVNLPLSFEEDKDYYVEFYYYTSSRPDSYKKLYYYNLSNNYFNKIFSNIEKVKEECKNKKSNLEDKRFLYEALYSDSEKIGLERDVMKDAFITVLLEKYLTNFPKTKNEWINAYEGYKSRADASKDYLINEIDYVTGKKLKSKINLTRKPIKQLVKEDFVEIKLSIADLVFREYYIKIFLSDKEDIIMEKASKVKKLIKDEVGEATYSMSDLRIYHANPSLYAPCTTINIDKFYQDVSDNYCFSTTSEALDSFKKGVEYSAYALGIASMGVTGGSTAAVVVAGAELATIMLEFWLEMGFGYPENLVFNPNTNVANDAEGRGDTATGP